MCSVICGGPISYVPIWNHWFPEFNIKRTIWRKLHLVHFYTTLGRFEFFLSMTSSLGYSYPHCLKPCPTDPEDSSVEWYIFQRGSPVSLKRARTSKPFNNFCRGSSFFAEAARLVFTQRGHQIRWLFSPRLSLWAFFCMCVCECVCMSVCVYECVCVCFCSHCVSVSETVWLYEPPEDSHNWKYSFHRGRQIVPNTVSLIAEVPRCLTARQA